MKGCNFIFISHSVLCFNYILILGSLCPDLSFLYLEVLTLVLWVRMAIFCPVELHAVASLWFWWFGLRRFGWREAKMRTFWFNFCMFAVFSLSLSLDLLTQIIALSHPDFYHREEPIRLGYPVPLLESTCSCSQISTFCATRAPSWTSWAILSQSSSIMGTGT